MQSEMFIDFRDVRVKLAQGGLFVVPKGVEHKPFAERECRIESMCIFADAHRASCVFVLREG
ncbi:hypothetical protein GYN08_18380 [Saccharibacillus sp. VR-M41]|uniref:Cupin n=1 Tax=Saccharibacillus alkalitolerans TaxID=2705290 RepID=A0ABX0FE96_9BACL|nr:hypothetical protein [Saccharibacillus alkalitolerans]